MSIISHKNNSAYKFSLILWLMELRTCRVDPSSLFENKKKSKILAANSPQEKNSVEFKTYQVNFLLKQAKINTIMKITTEMKISATYYFKCPL